MFDSGVRQEIPFHELNALCASLTVGERAELQAVHETNCAVKGPTFIGRDHFGLYRPLIVAGLIDWGPPPGSFSKSRYAGLTVTPKGMSFLDFIEAERAA